MLRGILAAIAAVALLSTAELPAFAADKPDASADSQPRLYSVSTAAELVEAVRKVSPSGGTISLAPGVYEIIETLVIAGKNSVNMRGTGWDTAVRKKGEGDAILFDKSHFCTVRDLLILGDPSATSGSGIVFRDGSSCRVDFCRICEFAVSGIRFEGNAKSPMSSNTVSNCHFIGNRQDQLYSFNNNDFYITGNQFGTHSKFPRTGCWLDHSSAGTYTMNYHWGNVNAFHLGPGSHFNRIENNRFEQSRETGIVIGDPKKGDPCAFNIITGNTIHTNSEGKSGEFPAVAAYDAHQTTFCQNQVFSWDSNSVKHKHGLVLGRNCVNWIVKDNNFRHSTGKSLVYDENAGHIVKDNLTD